jgi:hypothetical protein
MLKYSRQIRYFTSILVMILLLFAAGCSEESKNQNTPTNPGSSGLPADPGSGNLAGKVIGTVNRQPLSGVQVKANGKSTTTGSDGTFVLMGVGEGSFGVEISGGQVYTRLAAVNTATGRSVLLDAIEVSSSFNLGFYRELARGNHPNEKHIYPTHRWINSPTFYIDTDASATVDGLIDQNQINAVIDVIKEVLPVFTGGVYTSVKIVQKPFTSLNFDNDIPDNAYVLSFDDSLAWRFNAFGFTETDPTFVSPSTSSINKSIVRLVDDMGFYARGGISFKEVVAHEMGHGFGFRHTSLLPSVMVAIGAFGGLYGDMDRVHMKVVYSRPAGNSDIDNDPIPGAKQTGTPVGRQVFIDRRATFPLTSEEVEQLQALPTKIPAEDLLKHQSAY